jgi:tetratricopeptide (TPR) repeat protein
VQDNLDDLFGGLEGALVRERPQPFKFLDPYGPEDRAIFFGRESETAMLYAQFFKSRLTLVYGESGTGKTSLIDCGLRAQIPPEDMLFIPVRTALDPETALRQELLKQVPLADGAPEDLEALLREVIWRKHKTLVLVFDQFEEFFLFQPASVRTAFARQVAAWLEHGLDLRLLIGIREEYLARLTELEEYLPGLYQNRLWVRRMSREQAQEAITGPCQALGIAIEPELVADLLDTLTAGGQGVELPILQVVLDTLYRRAVEDDPEHPRLTRASYQALGQAQNILAQFIEERVSAYGDDAEPARQVLKTLVTAEGTRQLSAPAEIQERLLQFGSEVSEEQLMHWLRRLVDDRIVREDADHHLFELRHDALAARIWQWMTGIEQELIEVRQTLEHRLREYRQRGRLLDADVLAYLAPYENRLHLRGELAELVAKSKQQAARTRRLRQRRLIAGLVVGLLVALTLAGFAFVQMNRAEQERNRAEKAHEVTTRVRGQAEEVINYMLFDLRDKLQPVGRLDLLEGIAKKAGEYLEKLPSDEVSANSERIRAVALMSRGDVQKELGNLPGALELYQKALVITERLAQQDPANAQWQHDLMFSHVSIGTVRQAQGDRAGALAAYQAALTIAERLAPQDSANAQWQRDLMVSLGSIGTVRQAQNDLASALAAYEAALTIAERLAQQDPANAQRQLDLMFSRGKIGDVRQAQGDLAGALAAYEAALTIVERLAQQDPANAEWQRDLAVSHERLGGLHAQQGDLPQARASFEKELAIASKLFARSQAPEAPRFLAIVYTHLAEVCAAQSDMQAALDYQRRLVAEQRKLANPPDLAQTLLMLASLEDGAGNTRAALEAITEALPIARDLYAKQQDNSSRQFLAQVLGAQSFTLLVDRQFKEAITAAEEALALDPNQLWIATNQAHGYLLSGQFEKAKAIYRRHARDKVNNQQTFAAAVLDDFAKLRQRGIDHPDMKKIEIMLHATLR